MERQRKEFLSSLDQLDLQLERLFRDMDKYPQEKLSAKPAQDVWSPMEVLYHIYLSERGTLAYVEKKLSFDPKLRKRGLAAWFRSTLLNFYVRSTFKFKAPATVRGENLPSDLTYGELKERFIELRANWKEFLEKVDSKWFDREVFRHPIAGRISLGQTMAFLQSHFERHRKQIMARVPALTR